jgi:hypothetical protein
MTLSSLAASSSTYSDVSGSLAVVVAGGAAVAAFCQLAVLRRQLHGQQEVIADQARLFERQQANLVDLETWWDQKDELVPRPIYRARIHNRSDRPIRHVSLDITAGPGQEPRRMTWLGTSTYQQNADGSESWEALGQPEGGVADLIRADSRHEFEFDFDGRPHGVWVTALFRDDVGLDWRLDQDMHLEKRSSGGHLRGGA